MSYHFHPAAEAEHLEAVGYYESKQAGLGASYLAEFEKTMSDVCDRLRGHDRLRGQVLIRATDGKSQH